jgi:hypothetical protein
MELKSLFFSTLIISLLFLAGCTSTTNQANVNDTVAVTRTNLQITATTSPTSIPTMETVKITITPMPSVNAETLSPKNTQGWLKGAGVVQNTEGEWLDTKIEFLFPKTWSSTGIGLHSPDSSTNVLISAIPSDGWSPKDSTDRGYISNDDFGAIVNNIIAPTSGISNITPDPNYYLINGKPTRMFSADYSISSGYNQVMRNTGLPEKNVPVSVTGYAIIMDANTSVLGIIESDTRHSKASDIETGKDIVKTVFV